MIGVPLLGVAAKAGVVVAAVSRELTKPGGQALKLCLRKMIRTRTRTTLDADPTLGATEMKAADT